MPSSVPLMSVDQPTIVMVGRDHVTASARHTKELHAVGCSCGQAARLR